MSPRQQRRRSSVKVPKRRPSLAPSAGSEATQQERRYSLPLALALDSSASQEHEQEQEHEHGSSRLLLLQNSWKEEEEQQQQQVLGEVLYWC
jgi:hypothetical protein